MKDLRDEAEKRLKMEAAIRGVGLLSSPATRVAPKAQKAGALLALAKLGQIDFALSLLDELWRKDEVETSTAVWLINQSLKSDDLNTQNDGAEILDSYATRLAIAGHMRWPDHVRGRCPSNITKPDISMHIIEALVKALISQPHEWWDSEEFYNVLFLFYSVISSELSNTTKASAGLFLDRLLDSPRVAKVSPNTFMTPSGIVSPEEMKVEAGRAMDQRYTYATIVALGEKLEIWGKDFQGTRRSKRRSVKPR